MDVNDDLPAFDLDRLGDWVVDLVGDHFAAAPLSPEVDDGLSPSVEAGLEPDLDLDPELDAALRDDAFRDDALGDDALGDDAVSDHPASDLADEASDADGPADALEDDHDRFEDLDRLADHDPRLNLDETDAELADGDDGGGEGHDEAAEGRPTPGAIELTLTDDDLVDGAEVDEGASDEMMADHLGVLHATGEDWDLASGLVGAEAFDHVLQAGGVAWEPLLEVVERLGLTSEFELGLDAHASAVVLGEMGVDAIAEHGSLDDLAHRLDAGDDMVCSAADGSLVTVLEVGDTGVLVAWSAGADQATALVPGDAFEDAWSDSGYAMVTVEPTVSVDGPISLGSTVTVLQLSLPDGSLG